MVNFLLRFQVKLIDQNLMNYLNISGYKFTNLTNLESLKKGLKSFCDSLELKGTILIGSEGINAFVSGKREQIDSFYAGLHFWALPTIDFKESLSDEPPFDKMVVKIRKEIVTMGVPEISPGSFPAPNVSAEDFKKWLDENEEIIVLDTRNRYEVSLGKFEHAIDLDIQHFRSFPEAIKKLPAACKSKKIVTYCTGGIRCEKAAPYLISQGFQEVYQLEGGILKYLEKCGNAHFHGECFVFDKRIAVNHALEETETVQCLLCRSPVCREHQDLPEYVPGVSCPHCAITDASQDLK